MDQRSIHQQNTATLLLDQVPRVTRVVAMARPRCNLRGFFWGIILQRYENHSRVRGSPQRKHEIGVRPLVAPPGGGGSIPFTNRGYLSSRSSSTGKRSAQMRSKHHLISGRSHLFTVPGVRRSPSPGCPSLGQAAGSAAGMLWVRVAGVGTRHWPFDVRVLLGVACRGGGGRSPRGGGSCCRCEGRPGLGALPLAAARAWGTTPLTKAHGAPPRGCPPSKPTGRSASSQERWGGARPSYPHARRPRDTGNGSRLPAPRTSSRERRST